MNFLKYLRSNRSSAMITGGCVICSLSMLFAWGYRAIYRTDLSSRSPAERGLHEAAKSKTGDRVVFGKSALDKIQDLGKDSGRKPAELLSIATKLCDQGLGEDLNVIKKFLSIDLTPSELAMLVEGWKNPEGKAVMVDQIVQQTLDSGDMDGMKKFIAFLSDRDLRYDVISRIGKNSSSVSPEKINEMLVGLSGEDKRGLSEGVSIRLGLMSGEERMKIVREFFETSTDADFLSPLTSAFIGDLVIDNPSKAVEWSLNNDAAYTRAGDRELVRQLGEERIELTTSFVNGLLDTGQVSRASDAVGYIASSYFVRNPAGAVEWASQLPSEINSRQKIILQNLYVLNSSNPTKAQELVDRIGSESVSNAFAVVKRASGSGER